MCSFQRIMLSRSALVSSSSPLRRIPERRRSLAGSSGTLPSLFDRELASTSGCLSNGKPKAIFSYRTLGRASPFGQEALTVPLGTRRSCPSLLSRSICSLCAASPCCNGYSTANPEEKRSTSFASLNLTSCLVEHLRLSCIGDEGRKIPS